MERKIDDINFKKEVLESNIPVLVDFWAEWCMPCHMVAPAVEEIAKEYQGKLKVCKLNIDEGRQTAIKYDVMSIPTLNIYKNGDMVDQIIGVTPGYEADIKKKIEPYLEQP